MGFKSREYGLKGYQSRAVQFIDENRKALIAAGTGLGKSLISTYSIYNSLKENYRVLFITEKSAIDDVADGCMTKFFENSFSPWNTIGYNHNERQSMYPKFLSGEIDSIVTTYAMVRNDRDYLLTMIKHLKSSGVQIAIVIDEATQVKNSESQNHKVIKQLIKYSDLAIALTATPIASKLVDIHNIIKCLGISSYMSDGEFQRAFEISQTVIDGFIFKLSKTKLYLNSEEDELPQRILIKGKPFFKIPWAIPPETEISNLTLHTKRRQNIANPNTVYIPSLRPLDSGNLTSDLAPYIRFDKVSSVGKAYLYIPSVKTLNGDAVRFKSVKMTINTKRPGRREHVIETSLSFSYQISGNTIGYKNISSYKEHTSNVLFTMDKSEAGEIPNSIKLYKNYVTDNYTKKSVAQVYSEGAVTSSTSVARIMIASSNPSHVLEDGKKNINSKARALLDLLDTEISKEPILIYSPYTTVLDFLYEILHKHSPALFHGKLSDSEREQSKNDFRSGRKNILLISNAASKGINLQKARTVIFYDMPYTYENYSQVAGRISRLGSTHQNLLLYFFKSESEYAIENCLYKSVMSQTNFVSKVDSRLVDLDLIDNSISDTLDPEDADTYLLKSLGHSKSYYCH